MVKSAEETIEKFNEQVNMTVEELESWLETNKSHQAGTGVGLESGRKIVAILKKNPTKDPSKYDEEDLEHMRKVVGYNGRHLAQEDRLKDTKSQEELANTKSTISLKNWGHDPLKTLEPGSDVDAEGEELGDEDAEGEPEDEETEEEPESPKGTKRKHDEAETAKNDEEDKVDSEEEVIEVRDEQEDTQEIEEGRPSKSRKVDADAEQQVEGNSEDREYSPNAKGKSGPPKTVSGAKDAKALPRSNPPRKSRQSTSSK